MARYSSQFPDPVALVTVAAKDKKNVMAVGWTSPISFNPPILMVSIAPPRFTHDLLLEASEFGVSILAEDQKELSTLAGTLSGRETDKLAMPEIVTFAAQRIAAPLVSGARAWFECKLVLNQTVGDHTVFYGEVLVLEVDETKAPLILFDGGYYALGKRIAEYP